MIARITWRSALAALALMGLLVAHEPAAAAWYVDHVDYSYFRDSDLDEYVYRNGKLVARKQRTVTNSSAWVTLTGYFEKDEENHPIPVDLTLKGRCHLRPSVWLAGGPRPRPKPSTWPQRSWVDGHYSLDLLEKETAAGDYVMEAESWFGIPNPGQPTLAHRDAISSAGVNVHEWKAGSQYLEEQQWYSRPVRRPQQEWYTAAFLWAEVSIDMTGGDGGTIVADAQTWRASWGIYYQ